jgi:hypothetical protein
VADYGVPTVCVTGGEPLAQKNCLPLLAALCDAGYSVSLETSGALDVSQVDPRVSRIVDIKPPASGEAARNRWENLAHLTPHDEIKFVLADRADYDWAREVIQARTCTGLPRPVFAGAGRSCRRRNWPTGFSPTAAGADAAAVTAKVLWEYARQMKPAVVLLSGGLDSATVLAIAREAGYACHALSLDYGQRYNELLPRARWRAAWGRRAAADSAGLGDFGGRR